MLTSRTFRTWQHQPTVKTVALAAVYTSGGSSVESGCPTNAIAAKRQNEQLFLDPARPPGS